MDKLVIGIIRRSHGVRGLMRVASLSGESEHFLSLETVTLRKESREAVFRVEQCRIMGADILMKLEGLDTPEAVGGYASWEICVPRELASPLRDGEYYITDLCGCSLVYDGKEVGTVRSIIDAAASQMLEVVLPVGRTCLVPFMNEHVGGIDLEGRTIELKSEWLLS